MQDLRNLRRESHWASLRSGELARCYHFLLDWFARLKLAKEEWHGLCVEPRSLIGTAAEMSHRGGLNIRVGTRRVVCRKHCSPGNCRLHSMQSLLGDMRKPP